MILCQMTIVVCKQAETESKKTSNKPLTSLFFKSLALEKTPNGKTFKTHAETSQTGYLITNKAMKNVQPLQSIALKTETKTIEIGSQLSDEDRYSAIVLSSENLKNVAQAVRKAKNDLGNNFTKENYDYLILQEKKREYFRRKREAYFQSLIQENKKRTWTKQEYFKFLFETFQKRFPGKYIEFSRIENKFFMMLLSYFTRDEASFLSEANEFSKTAGKQRFSLDKGIILIGNKGVGKTTIMKLFSMNPTAPYRVVSVQEMAKQVESQKLEGLDKYSTLEKVSVYDADNYYFGNKSIGLCIDDMGVKEESLKSWGNERNIIDLVVQERYFREVPANMTFITTNSEPKDWIEKYDSRTVDRFREMFNIFWYPTEESKRN